MPLKLAAPFQDHAVLQRDQGLPVWGWGAPGVRVRVDLAGNEAHGLVNESGQWFVRLPALPAGGPHTLRVSTSATGETITISDLLVGEVWLASGQSNMEWTLNHCLPLSAADIAAAECPQIRFFGVKQRAHLGPHATADGRWLKASPESAPAFSAVAYYFARRLHAEFKVPVGILSASWGGTFIENWSSRAALAHNPDIAARLVDYEAMAWTAKRWGEVGEYGLDGRIPTASAFPSDPGLTQPWQISDLDDSEWEHVDLPCTWQSAGHGHSGVFWYRREIELPAVWRGRELELRIGAADKHDITFVNGVEVGRTGSGFETGLWNVPRVYRVPGSLTTGGVLKVAVRVYSFFYNGGLIGPASGMVVHLAGDPSGAIPLSGAWRQRCEHDFGVVEQPIVLGHGEPYSPHILFDNMIAPLIPYALRGAIWYQGEGNARQAPLYGRLLRGLVDDWRRHWGLPALAFHVVQLPGFGLAAGHQSDSRWARLREEQLTVLGMSGTGVAIAVDLGEADDVHPKNKRPVGERLARSVLAGTYGRDFVPCGPIADRFTFDAGSVRIAFRHVGAGLHTTDGKAPALCYVAGEDREFHPATGWIEGDFLVVSCSAVPAPVAVRYAWADNPEGANLANSDGLPASPFRSDSWQSNAGAP